MNPTPPDPRKARRRDVLVAAACGAFVAAMVGAAYAAVPLYSWFCRTTGFGGTPVLAHGGPVQVLDRKVTVRFDANVASGLPWKFAPEQVSIDVRIGEIVTVLYRAENDSARETVGQAVYNVTPSTVGGYFAKINCFCFTEQRLKPHERRDMPVVFYVDPALVGDAEQDGLNTITLSYTMYPVQQPAKPVVENTRPAGPGPI
jgi:cytochrome c oxidase assembly protein subunit 11